MTIPLLDILADADIRTLTPKITCCCGNTDPKKWNVQDRPIRTLEEFRVVLLTCDDCYRASLYFTTLAPSVWEAVRSRVKVMLAQNAMQGLTAEQLTARIASCGQRKAKSVDAKLDRLRDENLEGMFR